MTRSYLRQTTWIAICIALCLGLTACLPSEEKLRSMYDRDREDLHEFVEVTQSILEANTEAVTSYDIKEVLAENPDYQRLSGRLEAYDINVYRNPLTVRFEVNSRWDGMLAATYRGITYNDRGTRVASIEAASELGIDEDGRGNYSAFIPIEGEWGLYQDAFYD